MDIANQFKGHRYDYQRVKQFKGVKKPQFWMPPQVEDEIAAMHNPEAEARFLAEMRAEEEAAKSEDEEEIMTEE